MCGAGIQSDQEAALTQEGRRLHDGELARRVKAVSPHPQQTVAHRPLDRPADHNRLDALGDEPPPNLLEPLHRPELRRLIRAGADGGEYGSCRALPFQPGTSLVPFFRRKAQKRHVHIRRTVRDAVYFQTLQAHHGFMGNRQGPPVRAARMEQGDVAGMESQQGADAAEPEKTACHD